MHPPHDLNNSARSMRLERCRSAKTEDPARCFDVYEDEPY